MLKNIFSLVIVLVLFTSLTTAQDQPQEMKKSCTTDKAKCEQTKEVSDSHPMDCKCEKCTEHAKMMGEKCDAQAKMNCEKHSADCKCEKCAEHAKMTEENLTEKCKSEKCDVQAKMNCEKQAADCKCEKCTACAEMKAKKECNKEDTKPCCKNSESEEKKSEE